jgi:hypothetical protein
MAVDNRNFYITYNGHPRYKDDEFLIEDALLNVLQKIEMTLFSNQGDYIGDLNYGCSLELYIWETSVSAEYIKNVIIQQFSTYIPELASFNYTLDVYIMEGKDILDILVVEIVLEDYAIKAVFE